MLLLRVIILFSILRCLQMTVQLKAAEDDKASLQQALKSEIELRMQLEGAVRFMCNCISVSLCELMSRDNKNMLSCITRVCS